ncbi:ABC transporter permease subunit [Nonomuraea phyllanthi]|uniref:ABC transporter permease subunit n=1 Tax=Nonomuraea phyllanthi TaxID=2219224 RepID=A0A5C4V2N5_9ACTN|nr:iron ABC transporter permease [Nonomuraea phyllanthi]KAB8185167.1 ABC transporter permease subunit [Nonomuraea phyllanthi]QFY13398.1 ABC transporter permease subunit [Nonomuraea phyllanthi]
MAVLDKVEAPPPPRKRRRLLYRLRVLRHDPTAALGLILVVVLAYLVVAPLVAVLSDAFRVQYGDDVHAGQQPGEWTGYYLWRVFRSQVSGLLFWEPLLNTLVVSLGTVVFALVVGGGMAWLVTRTNVPGRVWLAGALVVPYMLPSWTFSLAWLTLFKNERAGGQLGVLQAQGVRTPDWLAYGPLPIVVCLGLHYYPFVFLLVGNALRRIDAQLEDSARILGAPRRVVIRRIVAPLMLPALSSAVLLVVGRVLGTFGTPYVLGLPTDYRVLSTGLYQSIRDRSTGVASVLAAVIVVIGVLIVFSDARLLREHRRFVTVGGKGAMDRLSDLRRSRWPAFGLAMAAFVVSVLVPVLTLLLSSVTRTPMDLSTLTLSYWFAEELPGAVGFPHGVFRGSELWTAAWNSLRIVGLAAVICAVAGLLIGYVVVRGTAPRVAGFLRQVSFLPYLIPGIAFAAASLSLFAVARGPVPALYGTTFLLILVMAVTHLPYSSRSGIAAMTQLGREPEEAAQVAGASWWQRMRRIIFPIQKGALVTGIVLPFISGLKELSIVIMLTTTGTQLLTTLSIGLVDYGYTQLANAVVLVIALVSFTMTYLTQRLTKSSLAAGLGG